MSDVIFNDKAAGPPDEEAIKEALGALYPVLKEMREFLQSEIGPIKEEWKFYSVKHGWQMKNILKKRNLFFLLPFEGWFTLGFIFGEKAAHAIEESLISEELKEQFRHARKYAEGRGIRVEFRDSSPLNDFKELVRIKKSY